MEHFRKCVHRIFFLISVIVLILSGNCWAESEKTFGSSDVVDPLPTSNHTTLQGNGSSDVIDDGNRRYKVAVWDFSYVAPAFVLATTLLVASLAKIGEFPELMRLLDLRAEKLNLLKIDYSKCN